MRKERKNMKIRIKFAKYGSMKFIGHLDMMRYFQKAIRRAGIDIRYSEGFSPHQIMSFAAPLGVGIESLGEYLDIEAVSLTSTNQLTDALNETMVEGVQILAARILPDTVKNAMASVAAASYQIHLKEGTFPIPDLQESAAAFYAQAQIPYTKETKKSIIEVDLKQGIYEMHVGETKVLPDMMSAAAAMLLPEAEADCITVTCICMTVDASSSGNIKPTVVFEKFCEFTGCKIPLSNIQVTRLETYTNSAREGEKRQLVPLLLQE